MDEVTTGSATVGEQLKSARETAGITLDEVAARTRIPLRHLQSLEVSEWDRLPAPTYTIGFAKSYAGLVGLDREVIADALRTEMGAGVLAARPEAQVFEPVDPARVMPRWLVLAALIALAAVIGAFLFLRSREMNAPDPVTESAAPAVSAATAGSPAPTPPAPASGPVVITANEPAWIQVSERGGRTLQQGELAAGQSYEVPANAVAPVLRTGRPQSIRISVGTADAPPVGPPDVTVSNVSLAPADLMRGPAPAAAPPVTPPAR